MAADVRSLSYADNSGVAATGVTMTEPSGTANGDILVAVLYVDDDQTGTLTLPGSWTSRYFGISENSQFTWSVSTIVRGGSAPSLTWSWTNSVLFEMHLFAISGANTTIDSLSADGGTGPQPPAPHNPDPPSTTATGAATLALAGGMNRGGSDPSPWTASSGYTIVSDNGVAGRRVVVEKKVLTGSGENPGAVSGAINAERDWWDGFTMTFANVGGGSASLSPSASVSPSVSKSPSPSSSASSSVSPSAAAAVIVERTVFTYVD